MKNKVLKKLRDLTKEEYKKLKQSLCPGSNNCSECMFQNVLCNPLDGTCWIYNKDLYSDKFLDQVVEIEEEMPKLTEQEKYILKNIDPSLGYKYIVRNKYGSLYICEVEPIKGSDDWYIYNNNSFIYFPFRNLFQFVKWEDEKPYLIKDLLEE